MRYEALVSQVELLHGGELTSSSTRRLSDRGWGLLISEPDQVAFIRDAGARALFEDIAVDAVDSAAPVSEGGAGSGRPGPVLHDIGEYMGSGRRVAFLELLRGHVLALGSTRACGLDLVLGPDGKAPQLWDLEQARDRPAIVELIARIDPVIVHYAEPRRSSPTPAGGSEDAGLTSFALRMLAARSAVGSGISVEAPPRSKFWQNSGVKDLFGTLKSPL